MPFLMLVAVSTPLHFSSVKHGGFEPRRDPLHFSSVKHCRSCPSRCVGGLSLTPCTSPQLNTAVFVPLLMLLVVSAPLHFSSVKQGGSEPRREGPCFMVSSSCHGVGVVPLQLRPTSSMTPSYCEANYHTAHKIALILVLLVSGYNLDRTAGPAVQWSITCLVRLTYVVMTLRATGVNLAWCLLSYRVALPRMASSILFVHILRGLASSIVASISLGPWVTQKLTLSYLATIRLRHLQLLIFAGGSVCVGWC